MRGDQRIPDCQVPHSHNETSFICCLLVMLSQYIEVTHTAIANRISMLQRRAADDIKGAGSQRDS
jgi:hypothetical protein